jgi:hypothetical protein
MRRHRSRRRILGSALPDGTYETHGTYVAGSRGSYKSNPLPKLIAATILINHLVPANFFARFLCLIEQPIPLYG